MILLLLKYLYLSVVSIFETIFSTFINVFGLNICEIAFDIASSELQEILGN